MRVYKFTLSLLTWCVFTSFVKDEKRTGWFFLAESADKGILIQDVNGEDIYAVEPTPIISTDDIQKLRIVQRDFQPKSLKVIEVKLTKDGKQKWKEIQKRISKTGEALIFICENKAYIEYYSFTKSRIDSQIDLHIEDKYRENVFSSLKSLCHDCR